MDARVKPAHDPDERLISLIGMRLSRQKLVGWILIVVSVAYIAYFLRVRLFTPGPVLERKEWVQFIGSFGILMLGAIQLRMAAVRGARRQSPPQRGNKSGGAALTSPPLDRSFADLHARRPAALGA